MLNDYKFVCGKHSYTYEQNMKNKLFSALRSAQCINNKDLGCLKKRTYDIGNRILSKTNA